jgi:NAD(P)H-dependent FMN reductase
VTKRAPKILAFAGSVRKNSFNALTLARAVEGAKAKGGDVTVIELADFPLPMFDSDLADAGLPAKVIELRNLVAAHDGLLIASPEHSSSIPVLVKNLIDWLSRKHGGEGLNAVFQGKTAALLGATTGDTAALRGLSALSSILANIGVFVLPYPIGVSRAAQAFGPDGGLLDPKLGKRVEAAGAALAEMLARRGGAP